MNFNFNLGFIALCLTFVHVSVADPQTNEIKRRNEKYIVSEAVTRMTSRIPLNSTVGWKHFSYLQKHPRNFDVTFAVGPEKIIVRAPRIFLTLESPVFEREFEELWENAVSEETENISLPDLNPEAFKLFVELTILGSWSVEALTALDLPSNLLLHLMSICHKYEMATPLKNLRELTKDFLSNFGTRVKPEDFLMLTQAQLGTILASDELQMNETTVFAYATSWAEEQCKKQKLEVTGANMRRVLGGALYSICQLSG